MKGDQDKPRLRLEYEAYVGSVADLFKYNSLIYELCWYMEGKPVDDQF